MSTMADDDVNDRVNAGRHKIAMATEEEEGEELEPRRVPPTVVVAGIGAALLGVGLLAYLLYRNRRRRTIVQEWRSALPGRMSELRELGAGRMHDLRELSAGRMSELRDLTDELRAKLKKAL